MQQSAQPQQPTPDIKVLLALANIGSKLCSEKSPPVLIQELRSAGAALERVHPNQYPEALHRISNSLERPHKLVECFEEYCTLLSQDEAKAMKDETLKNRQNLQSLQQQHSLALKQIGDISKEIKLAAGKMQELEKELRKFDYDRQQSRHHQATSLNDLEVRSAQETQDLKVKFAQEQESAQNAAKDFQRNLKETLDAQIKELEKANLQELEYERVQMQQDDVEWEAAVKATLQARAQPVPKAHIDRTPEPTVSSDFPCTYASYEPSEPPTVASTTVSIASPAAASPTLPPSSEEVRSLAVFFRGDSTRIATITLEVHQSLTSVRALILRAVAVSPFPSFQFCIDGEPVPMKRESLLRVTDYLADIANRQTPDGLYLMPSVGTRRVQNESATSPRELHQNSKPIEYSLAPVPPEEPQIVSPRTDSFPEVRLAVTSNNLMPATQATASFSVFVDGHLRPCSLSDTDLLSTVRAQLGLDAALSFCYPGGDRVHKKQEGKVTAAQCLAQGVVHTRRF